jgi:alpha-tubulin suppressor-like RCC1 family protein
MPSGFKTFGEEEFDRVFLKETEIIDRFVGERLWSWGFNAGIYGAGGGHLGDGTTTNRSSPGTTAGGGTNWASVDTSWGYNQNAGYVATNYAAGIKTDGTLWTWGNNNKGQLGDDSITSRSSPGTTAGGGTNWKMVAVGGNEQSYNYWNGPVGGIKTDGTLWTWGDNYSGCLGTGNTTSRSSPGTTAGGGSNWKQLTFGTFCSSAAVKTDGTLWTWGNNASGQLGDGTTTNRSSPGTVAGGGTTWKTVDMGYQYSLAIKTDGKLWSWGYNNAGQLGDGSTTNRSSPGSATAVSSTTGWKSISAGHIHSGAIKGDGSLLMWGANAYGGIGDGTTTDRFYATVGPAGGGTNWKQISAGYYFSAAVKTDGTLWTWGYNDYGNLGDNTTTNRSSPGTTLGNSTWKSVAAGAKATLGIAD